jgi:hypothetical protein
MINEEWKFIDGYDYYEVSNLGNVRSLDREVKSSCGKEGSKKGKYERTTFKKGINISTDRLDSYGYPQISLPNRKSALVHKLVANAFIPKLNDNHKEINHIDGDKRNNIVSNLEWCDRSHNINHAIRTGLHISSKGEQIGLAKFSDDEMKTLKPILISSSLTHAEWGRQLNVAPETIAAIRKGRTWKHI